MLEGAFFSEGCSVGTTFAILPIDCRQAEKILREAPDGTKIYVPIRNAPRMSFSDRFWKKVRACMIRLWTWEYALVKRHWPWHVHSTPACQIHQQDADTLTSTNGSFN